MNKFALLALLSTFTFAATNCDKVVEKLDKQITKAQNAKKINEDKLEFLNLQKSKIEEACVDGKIDTVILKEIKSNTKYDYELKLLDKQQAKLDQKRADIEAKRAKELEKIEGKKGKVDTVKNKLNDNKEKLLNKLK